MSGTGFTDSHLHMVEDGYDSDYGDIADCHRMLACTARRDEWAAQAALDDGRVVRFYGIHPWYADEWSADTRSALLDVLSDGSHIGEIGLDSKRGDLSVQRPVFEDQLDIASSLGRVVTVHMVGTEAEVLSSLRGHAGGCSGVILHSYGSDSYVKPFTEIGCHFSVSPRILSRSDIRVSRLLKAIPGDRLLLETDAPHHGRGFTGMRAFAERLAGLMGTDADTLLGIADDNAGRLLDG